MGQCSHPAPGAQHMPWAEPRCPPSPLPGSSEHHRPGPLYCLFPAAPDLSCSAPQASWLCHSESPQHPGGMRGDAAPSWSQHQTSPTVAKASPKVTTKDCTDLRLLRSHPGAALLPQEGAMPARLLPRAQLFIICFCRLFWGLSSFIMYAKMVIHWHMNVF